MTNKLFLANIDNVFWSNGSFLKPDAIEIKNLEEKTNLKINWVDWQQGLLKLEGDYNYLIIEKNGKKEGYFLEKVRPFNENKTIWLYTLIFDYWFLVLNSENIEINGKLTKTNDKNIIKNNISFCNPIISEHNNLEIINLEIENKKSTFTQDAIFFNSYCANINIRNWNLFDLEVEEEQISGVSVNFFKPKWLLKMEKDLLEFLKSDLFVFQSSFSDLNKPGLRNYIEDSEAAVYSIRKREKGVLNGFEELGLQVIYDSFTKNGSFTFELLDSLGNLDTFFYKPIKECLNNENVVEGSAFKTLTKDPHIAPFIGIAINNQNQKQIIYGNNEKRNFLTASHDDYEQFLSKTDELEKKLENVIKEDGKNCLKSFNPITRQDECKKSSKGFFVREWTTIYPEYLTGISKNTFLGVIKNDENAKNDLRDHIRDYKGESYFLKDFVYPNVNNRKYPISPYKAITANISRKRSFFAIANDKTDWNRGGNWTLILWNDGIARYFDDPNKNIYNAWAELFKHLYFHDVLSVRYFTNENLLEEKNRNLKTGPFLTAFKNVVEMSKFDSIFYKGDEQYILKNIDIEEENKELIFRLKNYPLILLAVKRKNEWTFEFICCDSSFYEGISSNKLKIGYKNLKNDVAIQESLEEVINEKLELSFYGNLVNLKTKSINLFRNGYLDGISVENIRIDKRNVVDKWIVDIKTDWEVGKYPFDVTKQQGVGVGISNSLELENFNLKIADMNAKKLIDIENWKEKERSDLENLRISKFKLDHMMGAGKVNAYISGVANIVGGISGIGLSFKAGPAAMALGAFRGASSISSGVTSILDYNHTLEVQKMTDLNNELSIMNSLRLSKNTLEHQHLIEERDSIRTLNTMSNSYYLSASGNLDFLRGIEKKQNISVIHIIRYKPDGYLIEYLKKHYLRYGYDILKEDFTLTKEQLKNGSIWGFGEVDYIRGIKNLKISEELKKIFSNGIKIVSFNAENPVIQDESFSVVKTADVKKTPDAIEPPSFVVTNPEDFDAINKKLQELSKNITKKDLNFDWSKMKQIDLKIEDLDIFDNIDLTDKDEIELTDEEKAEIQKRIDNAESWKDLIKKPNVNLTSYLLNIYKKDWDNLISNKENMSVQDFDKKALDLIKAIKELVSDNAKSQINRDECSQNEQEFNKKIQEKEKLLENIEVEKIKLREELADLNKKYAQNQKDVISITASLNKEKKRTKDLEAEKEQINKQLQARILILENEEGNIRNQLNLEIAAKEEAKKEAAESIEVIKGLNTQIEVVKNTNSSNLIKDVYKAWCDLYKYIYREMFNGGCGYIRYPDDVYIFLSSNNSVRVSWSNDFVRQLFLFRKISLLNSPYNTFVDSKKVYLEVSKYTKQKWQYGTQYIMFLEVFDMNKNNIGFLYFSTSNSTDNDMERMYNNNIDNLKNLINAYNEKADLLFNSLNIQVIDI